MGPRGTVRVLRARNARVSGARGQATVELVGMLPILVVVALAAAQLLAAGVARELAGHAAQAGAMALLQGGEAGRAARDAVPGWARDRMTVSVRGRRVEVVLRPPAPVRAVGDGLAARAVATAGAES